MAVEKVWRYPLWLRASSLVLAAGFIALVLRTGLLQTQPVLSTGALVLCGFLGIEVFTRRLVLRGDRLEMRSFIVLRRILRLDEIREMRLSTSAAVVLVKKSGGRIQVPRFLAGRGEIVRALTIAMTGRGISVQRS